MKATRIAHLDEYHAEGSLRAEGSILALTSPCICVACARKNWLLEWRHLFGAARERFPSNYPHEVALPRQGTLGW